MGKGNPDRVAREIKKGMYKDFVKAMEELDRIEKGKPRKAR